MMETDSDVYICRFCGGVLCHNDGRFIPVNDKEKNIYRCFRCKSEFERIDKDRFLLKHKTEKVYLKEGGFIWQ